MVDCELIWNKDCLARYCTEKKITMTFLQIMVTYLRFPIITTFEFPGSFPVGSSKFADTNGCDPRR